MCIHTVYEKTADFYMGVYKGMYMHEYGICMYFYI